MPNRLYSRRESVVTARSSIQLAKRYRTGLTAAVIALLACGVMMALPSDATAGLFDDFKEAMKDAGRELRNVTTGSGTRKEPQAPVSMPAGKLSRDQVRLVQAKLNALGYNVGVADGIAGRKTSTGIARFRSDRSLPGGGTLNTALLSQLGIPAGNPTAPSPLATTRTESVPRQAMDQGAPSSTGAAQGLPVPSDRPLTERLLMVDDSVVLPGPSWQSQSTAERFSASQRQAAREYALLLAAKINAQQFRKIVANPMYDPGGEPALCMANQFLSADDRKQLLTRIPGARKAKRGFSGWSWAGDNEFAIRRSGKRFTEEHLPQILAKAQDLPLKVVFRTNVTLGAYDFDAKGFRLLSSRLPFSRGWRPGSSNLSEHLGVECGSIGQIAPNTRYLRIGKILPMAPDKAEALLASDSKQRSVPGMSRTTLEQWTFAQFTVIKDRQGRFQYKIDPVSVQLMHNGQPVADLAVTGTSSKGVVAQTIRPGNTQTNTQPNIQPGRAVQVATHSATTGANAVPGLPAAVCDTDCPESARPLYAPRQVNGRTIIPTHEVRQQIGFSPSDEQELAAYWNGLATAAWLANGGLMSSDQQDHLSDQVAQCLARRAVSRAQQDRYLAGKQRDGARHLRRAFWAGENQFARQRSRDAFVTEQWPGIQASLPTLPAEFSLLAAVHLKEYDFDKRGFPISRLSDTWFKTGEGCAFSVRTSGATSNLPDFLPMDSAAAEQLLQQLSEQEGAQRNPMTRRRPKLVAEIQAMARPASVAVGYQAAVQVQFIAQTFTLFRDTSLQHPVHHWTLSTPSLPTRRQAQQASGQGSAGADALAADRQTAARPASVDRVADASRILDPRLLFDDLDLLVAIRQTDNRISLNAVKQMVGQQKKFDDAYYGFKSPRVWMHGGQNSIVLDDYEPSVEPYFSRGERVSTSRNDDKTVQLLKAHLNWRLERSPRWPSTIRVLSSLRRNSQREQRFRLQLNRWDQIRESQPSLKYKTKPLLQALDRAGIDLDRVYLPDLNVGERKALRSQLFTLNELKYIPLFVLPWDYDDIRIPFDVKSLGDAMGTEIGISVPVELDLAVTSFEVLPVNERFRVFVAHTKPLELRVPAADRISVADTLDFRHGPAGNPERIKYAFSPRSLSMLGVNLGMTLKEADSVLREETDGLDREPVALSELSRAGGLSMTPCGVKRQRIKSAVDTRRRELIRAVQQACRVAASADMNQQRACRSKQVTLSPKQESELDTMRADMTESLPAECTPKGQLLTAFAAYDLDYGAGLTDRIVLYGTGLAQADTKLVAMSRIFADKGQSVDVHSKLDDKYGGHHVKLSRSSGSPTVWFEDPAIQDKISMSKTFKEKCSVNGNRFGVSANGSLKPLFNEPCGRFAAYRYVKDRHYMLLIDTDQSSSVSARLKEKQAEAVATKKKKAKAQVRF